MLHRHKTWRVVEGRKKGGINSGEKGTGKLFFLSEFYSRRAASSLEQARHDLLQAQVGQSQETGLLTRIALVPFTPREKREKSLRTKPINSQQSDFPTKNLHIKQGKKKKRRRI